MTHVDIGWERHCIPDVRPVFHLYNSMTRMEVGWERHCIPMRPMWGWLGETLQTDVSKTSLLSLSCALDCSCGVRSVHPKTVAKYAWIFTQDLAHYSRVVWKCGGSTWIQCSRHISVQEQRWAEDGGSISVYLPHGAEQSDPKPFRHHFLRGVLCTYMHFLIYIDFALQSYTSVWV